jgi:hypothetical protein
MKNDRRRFLKLFGVSTAAIAAAPAMLDAEPTVEVISSGAPEPLPLARADQSWPANFCPETCLLDVRDEPLWSQLRVEQNAMKDRYVLFQEHLGNDVTLAQTNMELSGTLMNPEMYCIKKIGFVFSPSTIPALRSAFINRYTLALWLGRKRYWEAPLASVFSVGEPDREKGFATLPDDGFMTLDIPLVIDQGLYFNLEVVGKPIHPCGKLTGWALFKGLHAVGIQ